VFLCLVVFLANSSIFIAFDEDNEKKNSTKQFQKNIQLMDSNKSENFNYRYKVDINSNKIDSRYIPINFTVDIQSKVKGKLENVVATAYIDDLVFNNIAVKNYNSFGISEREPVTIDNTDLNARGFSIAKGTWVYDDTNLDRLIENLKSGIKVKVTWNQKEEYVLIKDVEINKI
jgi:hypothetical protein